MNKDKILQLKRRGQTFHGEEHGAVLARRIRDVMEVTVSASACEIRLRA